MTRFAARSSLSINDYTEMYKSDLGTRFGTIRHLYISYMREPPRKGGIAPFLARGSAQGEGVLCTPKIFRPLEFFRLGFSGSNVQRNDGVVAPQRVAAPLQHSVQRQCNNSGAVVFAATSPPSPRRVVRPHPDARAGARIDPPLPWGLNEVKTPRKRGVKKKYEKETTQ